MYNLVLACTLYKLCDLDERESVQWAGQGLYPSVGASDLLLFIYVLP